MKIERHDIPTPTLEQFADEHGLILEIRERPVSEADPMRYYAKFARVEVMGDGVLSSVHGNGPSPGDAVRSYAKEIALTRIAVDAWLPTRREIEVPRLRVGEIDL